jgi:glycosyltransferase involved in cell wall biosynthesis
LKKKSLVSIIVPLFNEATNITPLYERMTAAVAGLEEIYNFEYIFTDNCSTDGSFDILESLSKKDNRIRAYRFSKNIGYQRSILTGYIKARGAAIVQLDCDLQDPPEMIEEFLKLFEDGYDVVYGIRRSRQEGPFINALRTGFYRMIDKLTEDQLPHHAGDFRLISRRVASTLKETDDCQPYLRGMIAAIGFRQTGIPYDRVKRERGISKFSFGQLISLALDGILYHSVVPLRVATLTAFAMAVLTFIAIAIYFVGNLLYGQTWPTGFATTTILTLFSITLNALFLGIIGEYLGRIYQQVKRRPPSVIEKSLNDDGREKK